MRETRPSGSEGGATEINRSFLPLSLNAASPRRRPLVIVGAILAIVLLSVFLPPFLKRDASDRKMAAPGRPAVQNEGQTAEGGHPTIPNTTDVRGLTPPGSPNPKSEISNSKSQIPADPERAAAEWVLNQKGKVVRVIIVTTHDKQRRLVNRIVDLPKEPFRLIVAMLVGAPDVDSAEIGQHLGSLTSLTQVALEHSPRVTNDVLSAFKQIPVLQTVSLQYTGVTAEGIIAIVKSLPIQFLDIDERQFSSELAPLLATTPSLISFGVSAASNEQLRQLVRVKHLSGLSVGSGGKTELRNSTWARLADELPNLRSMSIDNVQFDDAALAAIARLSNLEDLFLTRLPNVADVGLAQLVSAGKLKNLSLRNCGVTPLGLADFLESHPACQVVWDGADHRAVVEWVLSVGGKVQVAGRGAEWLSANVGL